MNGKELVLSAAAYEQEDGPYEDVIHFPFA